LKPEAQEEREPGEPGGFRTRETRPPCGQAVRAALNPGITWSGWTVPVALELAIVAGVGAVLLFIAARRFAKVD
jgi:hypothetical protein